MQVKIAALVVVVAFIAVSEARIACTPNFCDNVKCDNGLTRETCESNDNKLFVVKGGICGCCDACYTKLREGDYCGWGVVGLPPKTRCDHGLECSVKTLSCVRV